VIRAPWSPASASAAGAGMARSPVFLYSIQIVCLIGSWKPTALGTIRFVSRWAAPRGLSVKACSAHPRPRPLTRPRIGLRFDV